MTIKTLGQGDHYLSSDYLILLTELAFERGIAASDLFHGSGLDERLLLQPGVSVGHRSALALVERFCALTNDLSLAVEYGKRMTLFKHGVLGVAAQYSETMTDAANKMVRYLETRAQLLSMQRFSDDQYRRLQITPRFTDVDDSGAGRFLALAFLASVETICRTLIAAENKQTASCIYLSLEPGDNNGNADLLEQIQQLPFCTIKASDRNMLVWPTSAFTRPLPFFNPQMELVAERELEKNLEQIRAADSFSHKVAQLLQPALAQQPKVDGIASQLHMSAATLNRKLRAEGSSFQQIKDEVRYQCARQLLTQNISLEAIAAELGFSDASNFAKAFKNWAGETPAQFRSAAKEN